MKRFGIVLTAMFAMFAFMAMTTSNVQAQSDEATYTFNADVQPAIEFVQQNPEHTASLSGGQSSGLITEPVDAGFVRSNCPTKINYQGSALSRMENDPTDNGITEQEDVLETNYKVWVMSTSANRVGHPYSGDSPLVFDATFKEDGSVVVDNAFDKFYPHEGFIPISLSASAKSGWSDDAGMYTGELTITATSMGSYDDSSVPGID